MITVKEAAILTVPVQIPAIPAQEGMRAIPLSVLKFAGMELKQSVNFVMIIIW